MAAENKSGHPSFTYTKNMMNQQDTEIFSTAITANKYWVSRNMGCPGICPEYAEYETQGQASFKGRKQHKPDTISMQLHDRSSVQYGCSCTSRHRHKWRLRIPYPVARGFPLPSLYSVRSYTPLTHPLRIERHGAHSELCRGNRVFFKTDLLLAQYRHCRFLGLRTFNVCCVFNSSKYNFSIDA